MNLSYLFTILGGITHSNLNTTDVKIRFLGSASERRQSFLSGCQYLIECLTKEVQSLTFNTSHLSSNPCVMKVPAGGKL